MTAPHLSIVFPAYNEQARLPSTLTAVLAWIDAQSFDTEIVIVDDGSSDDTIGVARRALEASVDALASLRRSRPATRSSIHGQPASRSSRPGRPIAVTCASGRCSRSVRRTGVAITVSPTHDGQMTTMRRWSYSMATWPFRARENCSSRNRSTGWL